MKNLTLLLLSLFSITAFSQNTNPQINSVNVQSSVIQGFVPEADIDVSTFSGSVYTHENFVLGQIIDKLSQNTISSFSNSATIGILPPERCGIGVLPKVFSYAFSAA